MSIRIACLAFPLALLIASGGQESLIPAPAGPDHYKVGAYVTAIYDLNVAAGRSVPICGSGVSAPRLRGIPCRRWSSSMRTRYTSGLRTS